MMQTNKTGKKSEMWRKYKGTTAEEMCAAIRELWLAKYPDYIRTLNEVPNRLIRQIAAGYSSRPTGPMTILEDDGGVREVEGLPEDMGWPPKWFARRELRELERFLSKQPYENHFYENEFDLLEDELHWKNPDAPLSEYVEADKKRDALVEKFSIRPNEHV